MRVRRAFTAFISLLCLIVPAFALAGPEASLRDRPVVVESVLEAQELVRQSVDQVKKSGHKLRSVDLIHIGDDYPEELAAMLGWYRAHNIVVLFRHVSLKEFKAELDRQENAAIDDAWRAAKLIRYESGATDDPKVARRTLVEHAKRAKAALLHALGLYKGGLSFESFNLERTLPEKLAEGSFTGLKLAMGTFVAYHSMANRIAAGEQLNIPFGLITTAAFTIGFDYWVRAHNEFKNQGWAFDFFGNKFVANRKLFLLVSFVHTFVMRQAIMLASHMTNTVSSDELETGFFEALSISALGLLGRAPFEYWMINAQRKHSKWWRIGVNTAWGLTYAALQTAAQFHVQSVMGHSTGELFRYTMAGMGLVGLGVELKRNASDVVLGIDRFKNWIRGVNTRKTCQTLLLNEITVSDQE